MFDWIKCELPLPVGQDWNFQSKDTPDQLLTNYTIRADGRLIAHRCEWEEIPKAEKRSKWDIMRKVPGSDYTEDANYDGDIHFYGGGGDEEWIDYRATFRNGKCVELSQQIDNKWVPINL